MIGFYNYTVILTYLSLLSATAGIMVSLSGNGHPSLGVLFLLISGLLDAFDGHVARTKKNRTDAEKWFGVQIDSLSDLAAFGILPSCIGCSLINRSELFDILSASSHKTAIIVKSGIYILLALYSLAALIRLAYFNVLEQQKNAENKKGKSGFIGVPVTTAALVFPLILLVQHMTTFDMSFVYVAFTVLLGISFLIRVKISKPSLKGILIMIAVGAVEYALILTFIILRKKYI